jgi:LacI family transcriptional regulator
MAARLKDIAKDLGVSVITVSKVLRNHPDISEATRERVLKRVRELNYQPNLAARALVTGKTFCVGLIVPDLVHPFFAQVAKGLSGWLRDKQYGLLLASSEEDPDLERQEIEHLLARRVDALIVASAQSSPESFREVEERKTPLVLIDRQFTELGASFVGIDDFAAGVMATTHLIEKGCRRIAHIRGPEVSTALGRLAGYRSALRGHGLDAADCHVVREATSDESGDQSGRQAMLRLLRLDPRPDAVFCYNDPVAMGAMETILESGLRIPEDIALIGCGNVLYASALRVPLSTIDQKSAEIGLRAGEMALRLIARRKQPLPAESVLLAPELVVRASTRLDANRN